MISHNDQLCYYIHISKLDVLKNYQYLYNKI